MPTNFGTTPLSTTTLGANQFPVSSAFVPGTASGNTTAVEGILINTDGNGYASTAIRMGLKDGDDVTLGSKGDAAQIDPTQSATIVSILKGMQTELIDIEAQSTTTPVVTGTVTANIGTTNGLALEAGNLATIVGLLDIGQETMANSLSVVIASDQSAVPVSGTITANAGSGTFNIQANASVNINQVAGSAVATAATGIMKVGLTDGSGTAITSTSSALDVNIKSGSSSGTQYTDGGSPPANPIGNALIFDSSGTWKDVGLDQGLPVNIIAGGGSGGTALADDTAFTAGTTSFTPTGGVYNDAIANATSGRADAVRITQKRAFHSNLRDSSGNELLGSKTSANSIPVVIASDQGAVSITANSSVNVAQLAGTTTDTNSGNKSAGTLRVVIATDQPQLTNKLLVTPDSVALPANQSVNVAQINGVTPLMGNGVTGTGSQRVTIASDNTAFSVNANAGTNLNTSLLALEAGGNLAAILAALDDGQENMANSISVAIASDQSNVPANITQFGGNTVATGTGAGGVGIPRVTVSNDSQVQLWDGTTGPVAAKAANTSPVLADKAMVHSISPNNTGLPVNLEAIVQKTNNKSTGSVASLALAFGSNNIVGNSIIVECGVGNGTAPTITDTAGNTYTQAAQIANGTALNTAVFYAVNIAAGANTVTVNNGGTTASIAMEIYEVSGLITQVQAQPDATATNTGSSGTASTGTISAASPNEYAFAAVGIGTAVQTITAGSGWTNDSGQQNPTTPAGLFSFVSLSQFLGSLKAVTPQATFTSEPWAIAVASFRPVILGVEGSVKLTDGTVNFTAGSKTSANSFPVVIASDQGNVATNVAQFGGSNAVTGTGASGAGIPRVTVSNDSTVGANSATGSAVPTNAFYKAGIAKTALPAAATDGNLTGDMVDKFGRQVVMPYGMRDILLPVPQLTLTASTSETTLIAAVASQFSDILSIIVLNTSATACLVDFRDSTGGTIRFSLYVPAGETRGFTNAFFGQNAVNNNWTAKCGTSVSSIIISGNYVTNK